MSSDVRVQVPPPALLINRMANDITFGHYVSMIGNTNGWPCPCGNIVAPHLLTCPKCKHRLSLDKVVTGVPSEAPAPPIAQWVKEDGIKRTYSAESMDEIMAQARKRKKNAGKRSRTKSSAGIPKNPSSSGPWLITILITAIGLGATFLVSAYRPIPAGWVSYSIIGLTTIISIAALNNQKLIQKYVNASQLVCSNHDYYRLLSAGVLHANGIHLLLNMYALYSFGPFVETQFNQIYPAATSSTIYLAFYISAIIVSNIPSYLRHRKKIQPFSSLGASGAICAVIGAAVLVNPRSTIVFMGIIPMPAYVFFLGFLAISEILAQRAKASHRNSVVDHSAHITGAIYGFLVMAAIAYGAHIDPISNFLHPRY